MLQFFGEFVKAEPAGGKGGSAHPPRVQVQFLNQPAEWFTVEDLIQVRARVSWRLGVACWCWCWCCTFVGWGGETGEARLD
jgi:hypothetical protein